MQVCGTARGVKTIKTQAVTGQSFSYSDKRLPTNIMPSHGLCNGSELIDDRVAPLYDEPGVNGVSVVHFLNFSVYLF